MPNAEQQNFVDGALPTSHTLTRAYINTNTFEFRCRKVVYLQWLVVEISFRLFRSAASERYEQAMPLPNKWMNGWMDGCVYVVCEQQFQPIITSQRVVYKWILNGTRSSMPCSNICLSSVTQIRQTIHTYMRAHSYHIDTVRRAFRIVFNAVAIVC